MRIWMNTRQLVLKAIHDRWLVLVAILIVVALLFHLYNLGYGEFTDDETQVATATG